MQPKRSTVYYQVDKQQVLFTINHAQGEPVQNKIVFKQTTSSSYASSIKSCEIRSSDEQAY